VAADQKGAAVETAWIVFVDESAVSLIHRCAGPGHHGATPRCCGIGSAGRRPRWRPRWATDPTPAPPGCAFLQQPGYNTDTLIGVLDQLGVFYAGQRVVLIWDGLSAHWSTRMRAYLDSQRDWLTAERLPAYAPELNPVEYLWANLEDVELANLPTTTLVEVTDAAHQGIQRVCKSEDLVVGFLAHTGLALDDEPST
jgi:hypothetical protein